MRARIFGIQEAAEYIGISVAALKYHVHVSKTIKPRKIGHSLIFTQTQLDKFIANRRKVGRPRKDGTK